MWPVLLFGLAGLLFGGLAQLIKSKATPFSIGLVGVLAVLAAAAGVAWMIPGKNA
jgi:hypothetical protein